MECRHLVIFSLGMLILQLKSSLCRENIFFSCKFSEPTTDNGDKCTDSELGKISSFSTTLHYTIKDIHQKVMLYQVKGILEILFSPAFKATFSFHF